MPSFCGLGQMTRECEPFRSRQTPFLGNGISSGSNQNWRRPAVCSSSRWMPTAPPSDRCAMTSRRGKLLSRSASQPTIEGRATGLRLSTKPIRNCLTCQAWRLFTHISRQVMNPLGECLRAQDTRRPGWPRSAMNRHIILSCGNMRPAHKSRRRDHNGTYQAAE